MFAKKGGRRRKEQREYTERIILTTCEMQKPKTYGYLALHDGAIEKMLHHGTTATNTELKAEQGFDERFTQRALYGSSVYLKVYQDNTASLAQGHPRPQECPVNTASLGRVAMPGRLSASRITTREPI